jgi:acyl-CoA thioesterase I
VTGRRALLLGVVVLLAVAVGLGVGPASRAVQHARDCDRVEDGAQAARGPFGTGPGVLVLGDSWSAGYGIPDISRAWPARLAELGGWRVTVDARSGSGYLNSWCRPGSSFPDRLSVPAGTDTVIVEGGLNDVGTPGDELRAAAEETVREARATARRVVVLGAPRVDARDPTGLAAVNEALAGASAAAGASFVDTSAWRIELQYDGLHPSERGAERFAQLVVDAVR